MVCAVCGLARIPSGVAKTDFQSYLHTYYGIGTSSDSLPYRTDPRNPEVLKRMSTKHCDWRLDMVWLN